MTKPMSRPYQRIFLQTRGAGPWPCFLCGKDVTSLIVHHIDENPKNNDPENLSAVHRSCHMSLHQAGRSLSEEQRRKLSLALTGRTFSDETRAKMSASAKRRKASPETRAKMSATRKGRKLSEEHKRNLRKSWRRKREAAT